MIRIQYFFLIALLAITACKKPAAPAEPTPPPVTPAPAYNYSSDKTYNLNVVYFIPNDVAIPTDHHRRLSEILLSAQDFFRSEMQRNGYGNKTFGLLKDEAKKRIKLIEIKGKQGKAAYPYEGGSGAVQTEIAAYKAANPSEFTSDHYLVIIPAYKYDTNGEPGGPPFYGVGKTCFALDYADQDNKYLGTGGTLGTRATKWIGGMIHELGHGLNLPHNRQKAASETSLGMSLMWAGNSTWGISPTFLTAADCAVLNTNQVFNADNKVYYTTVNASVQHIHADYDAGKTAIVVKGKYISSGKVTDLVYFNDPNVNNEGTGVNKDYNSIAWTSKPVTNDSFYIEMPIGDLVEKADNIPYELKVKLVHENGVVVETIYSYTFTGGVPVLTFSTRNELSKQGWSVYAFSSEETSGEGTTNGRAATVIDGNAATYWHSKWSGSAAVYPHELVIDLGSEKTANGLSVTQRSGLSRSVKNAELQISSDAVNFTSVNNYVFANSNGAQYFDFNTTKTFRYFKIIAKSAWDGLQFAALAEVGLY
ncbi:MAG: discoidin domain-containing protein [Chitinophagaceae bacterium]|nr:discoidin domain-containing protein [Chitinophagaceae bacterium]